MSTPPAQAGPPAAAAAGRVHRPGRPDLHPVRGAAILARYGGRGLQPWQVVLVLSLVSTLWLVVAVYFLGDISAHFNPVTTLAFALRRDMNWVMAVAYWIVQFAAAAAVHC
jgi:glycerol uptake facilitator-like aquaporin